LRGQNLAVIPTTSLHSSHADHFYKIAAGNMMLLLLVWSILLPLAVLLGLALHLLLNVGEIKIKSYLILGRDAPWYFRFIAVFLLFGFIFRSFELSILGKYHIESIVFFGAIYLSFQLFSRREIRLQREESKAAARGAISPPRPLSDFAIGSLLVLLLIALPLCIGGGYYYARLRAEKFALTDEQITYLSTIRKGDRQALLGDSRQALASYKAALKQLAPIRLNTQGRESWDLVQAAHLYRLGVTMAPAGKHYFDEALAILRRTRWLNEEEVGLTASIEADSSDLHANDGLCIRFDPLPRQSEIGAS
jgi:hypothetical protein